MLRFLIIFILLNFYNPAFSSIKEKIISQMKLTNILSFNFTQTIDEKIEKGSCIIKYPKKIFCSYDGSNNKVIVSNGKSLVIKIKNSGNYYIYPLNKTPLDLLLDKEYLISKISTIEGRIIDDKFLTFKIFENKNKINIFFDVKTFNLVGWQTEDIYQNLNITFISSIKINEKIDDKIFILPTND
jgi:outer membrane lipoprotein-sorting protein